MSDYHNGAGDSSSSNSSSGSITNHNSNNRVSPFPADLNLFSSPESDLTVQNLNGWTIEDDLAMFTNANFVNFDHADPALDEEVSGRRQHTGMTSLDGPGDQSGYLSGAAFHSLPPGRRAL